jgi:ATP-dependent Clp protease ATP-binding subunit ClpA
MGPFDRFNDRAKRTLALAQDEAIRFNHNYIGVEHLLLGLIREGEGVAARALNSLGVDLSKARTNVEFIIGRGDSTTAPSEITLSPRTKHVIELAIDEARKLGHSHVGTEHLLLSLVREGEGIASGVLESFGVSLEKVRHQVIATLGHQQGSEARQPVATVAASIDWRGSPASPLDRLDAASRRALARAYWEAGRANEDKIMPHHLLLGLVAGEEVWIRRTLGELKIDPADLAVRIDAAAPAPPGPRLRPITESPTLLEVISRAASIAAERNCAFIRGEHLLLAIAVGDGVGSTVLTALGATPQRVREIVDRMKG